MSIVLPPVLLDPEGEGRPPAPWEVALWGLVHRDQVAIIEAQLWIEEPLSATLLVGVFEDTAKLNRLSYHIRRLAQAGVLREVYCRQVRGALEHFYTVVGSNGGSDSKR